MLRSRPVILRAPTKLTDNSVACQCDITKSATSTNASSVFWSLCRPTNGMAMTWKQNRRPFTANRTQMSNWRYSPLCQSRTQCRMPNNRQTDSSMSVCLRRALLGRMLRLSSLCNPTSTQVQLFTPPQPPATKPSKKRLRSRHR